MNLDLNNKLYEIDEEVIQEIKEKGRLEQELYFQG